MNPATSAQVVVKQWLARWYVGWVMSRAQRVFCIYGLPCAGNHACVEWPTNALGGKPIRMIESPRKTSFN